MILAINTSTLQFSLALIRQDDTVAGEIYLSAGKRHFGALFPSLDFLLNSLGTGKSSITGVAVALGPGSFTGLRVGLASAKGLAHALRVPIVGVSSLEALAAQVPYSSLPITTLIESRRNDVFVAQFQWSAEGQLSRISDDQCFSYESLSRCLTLPSVFIGNDYEGMSMNLKRITDSGVVLAPPHLWSLRASSVGHIGLQRLLSGQRDDPSTLVPIYLRPPDIRANPYSQAKGIKAVVKD